MMSAQETKNTPIPSSPIVSRKKSQAPKRPSIQELKQKYESPPSVNSPKTPKPRSPKKLNKSKVKQMASMFNNRISQIIRRDTDLKKYSTLVNELSPEGKPVAKATLPKPLPFPMPRHARHTKDKAPVASPRSKSKAKVPKNSICFVAEDIFGKLSVKDKALLYSQFIGDMSKKNSKFEKHGELMEAKVKSHVSRGEVISEKQISVKRLLEDLEARCAFPKQTISPNGVDRINSVKQGLKRSKTLTAPIKSKEFEDILENTHISTLTVTLSQGSTKKRQRRARSLPRNRTEGDHSLPHFEPSHKRNNDEMRSTLPIEAYAPPKKIRRSRAEHLAPNTFFQNQQLETLFYSWLKERHQKQGDEPSEQPLNPFDEKPKSAIDNLLAEAIAKLETVEIKEKNEIKEKKENENEKVETQDSAPVKPISRKKRLAPAPPVANKPSITSESSTTSSTTNSAKHSEAEESESGLSTLVKTTSDECHAEPKEKTNQDNQKDLEFVQPIKPLRKKKMRRALTWKKDSSLVESKILPSTDSDSDVKDSKANNKKPMMKSQPLEVRAQIEDESAVDPSFEELDKTLMRDVNSPRKIKSAYTLTVFSPPPYTEEDIQDLNNSMNKNLNIDQDLSYVGKSPSTNIKETKKPMELPRSLTDSFDQGFETGSNDMDSPIRPPRKSNLKRQSKTYSPLFIKLGTESHVNSMESSQKLENPSCFSTPIKEHGHQIQNGNHSSVQQQLFSPISQPLKNRRRSLYESESRRTSLAMQVIREDQPLENHEIQSPHSLNSTSVFFANAPTMDMTDITGLNPQKTSSFWIKSGDFLVSLDVFHNDAERLRVLYEIFSQKSCDSQDLHFGIDNHKFSVHGSEEAEENEENISKRLPQSKDKSHYWFSTGDLAIPFAGKLMSEEKIQRLFKFIKVSVEETGILRFGVDATEFSNVSEFWTQLPKFSMESNYSMLVGLQSGNSNGLEGRSKYAWPHTKPVPVSDLDQSDEFECEDFEENDSARLSFSPFGSNHFDLASLGSEELMMPRNGEAMKSPDSFYMDFENEPLDRLFEEKYSQLLKTENSIPGVPTMINSFQQQQQRLSSVQERMSNYSNPSNLTSDALDALKNTPEYVSQLKSIVSDISKIGCNGGFRKCDLEQLERYMFFLSRYADICVNSCSDHMDKILDAMMDRKSMTV